MRIDTCESCAYAHPNINSPTGKVCLKYNKVTSNEGYCSEHAKSAQKCSCCGTPLVGKSFITMNGKVVESVICERCFQNRNTCKTCQYGGSCRFETDPSSLPKTVQKQVRQGNMTAVTQIMNPERVRITCQKGCHCWDQNFGCSKQTHGICQQYHMNLV